MGEKGKKFDPTPSIIMRQNTVTLLEYRFFQNNYCITHDEAMKDVSQCLVRIGKEWVGNEKHRRKEHVAGSSFTSDTHSTSLDR